MMHEVNSGGGLVGLAIHMAARDWWHERGLSFCAVVALASILAPLLILHGAHMGVVERLRARLMSDPAVLVLVPQGSKGAGFEPAFIEKIRHLPGMSYAMGRTRDVAAELQLTSETGRQLTVTLEATSPGDPMIETSGGNAPESTPGHLEITLSAPAARKLEVKAGDTLTTTLARRSSSGKLERIKLNLTVASVLPPMASGRDTGLADLNTLLALQDYRDNIPSTLLNSDGEYNAPPERRFESFRAYARTLDDVEKLQGWFISNDVPVNTRARDIANIRSIDRALGTVILLIAGAGCVGFIAFMASTSEASVRRKWKQMGMLRLTGFSRGSLVAYPLAQALLTGLVGSLLAFCIYGAVAYAIDFAFAAQTGGESICVITPGFMLLTLAGVEALAVLASIRAAWKAASVSPSEVIREI